MDNTIIVKKRFSFESYTHEKTTAACYVYMTDSFYSTNHGFLSRYFRQDGTERGDTVLASFLAGKRPLEVTAWSNFSRTVIIRVLEINTFFEMSGRPWLMWFFGSW